MKKFFMPVLLLGVMFTSCSEDDEIKEVEVVEEVETPKERRNLEVEEFMFAVMDEIYLYEADVPQLQTGFFSTEEKKLDYLESFSDPEDLYYDLVAEHDEFSFMTEDYVALNKLLTEGVSGTTGMDYGLAYFSNSSNIFGYVRYVMPNSPAEEAGVKRGDFFTEIDGVQMTASNYQGLLGKASFSMTIYELAGNSLSPTDKTVNLTKVEMAEDPILTHKIFETEGQRIGYIMYNSFTPTFDDELNAVFGEFKSAGITDLILDFRYNGGGNVETAIDIASMITGQFNDQVILQYQYNKLYQEYYQTYYPNSLKIKFNNKIRTGEATNSLNLSRVHVITTRSSASASELVIHALKPYIDVVQIGGPTRGKFQASSTFYDSPNFSYRNDKGEVHVNKNHNYALQPLIVKYANKNGESDFVDGLFPDVAASDELGNRDPLGDPSEPMLEVALNYILGKAQEPATAMQKKMENGEIKTIGESDMFKPNYQRMYLEDQNIPIMIPSEMK
ncbi:peptidase S41 [Salinimicrobium sp. CDJ15-81-2]|nr:peptidase S41 [Salinimicrobium nanhaiense]